MNPITILIIWKDLVGNAIVIFATHLQLIRIQSELVPELTLIGNFDKVYVINLALNSDAQLAFGFVKICNDFIYQVGMPIFIHKGYVSSVEGEGLSKLVFANFIESDVPVSDRNLWLF